MDKFTENRFRELKRKFGIDGKLELETKAPRTTQEVNAAQYVAEVEAARTKESQAILKSKLVAYGSQGTVRLWYEISR
jgi:hypothetical protein